MGFKAYPGADGSTPRLGGEGLSFIASTSFTTAASVSIDGCFTSIHSHYLVTYELSAVTGTDIGLQMRLRAASTDASGANYDEVRSYLYTTITGAADTSQTSFTSQVITTANPDDHTGEWRFYRPYMARKTVISTLGRQRSNAGTQYSAFIASCIHTLTTQYDGFTIYPASGTISGSLAVYGYQRA